MWHPADDFAAEVGEPFLYTFTGPLPFPLGIPDDLGHTIGYHEAFADPDDQEAFGRPTVDIRVFTFEEEGLPMWPPGLNDALVHFYDHKFDGDPEDRYGEGELSAHHQWVTLETPAAPTADELKVDDPAFAFHRCLGALDLFLRGVQAVGDDLRIRPIRSHHLRPVVVVGARRSDGSWEFLNSMLMHPGSRPDPHPASGGPITEDQLNAGLWAVQTNKPHLTTKLWRTRAQRALRQEGDASDAVISFQIAAESLLFDTYRMILVDEGRCSTQITADLEVERSFKSMLVTTMPEKLAGRWDVTAIGTPVAEYWERVYKVRNSVVHAGYEPHGGEAEAAEAAYQGLYRHLEDRLRARRNDYPRTVYARLGEDGLKRSGVLPRRMRKFLAEVDREEKPWHWPYDLAERDNRPGLG